MKDTAPVRRGEMLDLTALQTYLIGKVEGANNDLRLEQYRSGHSNLTYLLYAGKLEYVLRRAPLGPVAPKAHDMAREYHILDKLSLLYQPAPKVYHLCKDLNVIGAIFYLMERRKGLILRDHVPASLAKQENYAKRISRTLVTGLAELHAIDIEATGLGKIGKPEGFLERQVEGWSGRWERAKTSEVPDLERVIAFLRAERPDPQTATLVHNDYKLENIMLATDDPEKLEAVLDWEMTTVGDPLVDVGLSLVYWQQLGALQGVKTELGSPGEKLGWFSREQFLEHYANSTGRGLAKISWYEILGIFKLAVILQQIYARFVAGQTQDERFRDFDKRVAELAAAGVARLP